MGMMELKRGKLFFQDIETGEVTEFEGIGEITPVPDDNYYGGGRDIVRTVMADEVKIEFRGMVRCHYRTMLRMLGVGDGSNNWLKMRGGIMDRDKQIRRALKMARRKHEV